MDRMRHFVEVEAHDHRSHSQAVVAVEVCDEDARHRRRGDVGEDKLPLRPLSGVEEETLLVPAK